MKISCPRCGHPSEQSILAEVNWAAPEIIQRLAETNPGWQRADGACPACVQEALLHTLLQQGDPTLHEQIQTLWPLDAQAAFGALPTPLRLHADPRYTGQGICMAIIDIGFYPHADLVQPTNRIRAWVNAAVEPAHVRYFTAEEQPTWPEWQSRHNRQWHGVMTSVSAAGNGALSHGFYRGLASQADVILIQVREDGNERNDATLLRALHWVLDHGAELGIRVVNISLGGDAVEPLVGNPVDEAVAALFAANIVVTAAAGNDGVRLLHPPATAPHALTVGGVDDRNTLDHADDALWHSNYGDGIDGAPKPELVAPSIWVAAPVLPASDLAQEAAWLFAHRYDDDKRDAIAQRLAQAKLITPHYQHVDGTSFAAPLTASTIACMLEANPKLTAPLVRTLLLAAVEPIPNVPRARQGAGALSAGRAVAAVLQHQHAAAEMYATLPYVHAGQVIFLLHEHQATEVALYGSWDQWAAPRVLTRREAGIWMGEIHDLPPGRYTYKFVLDGWRWLDDPANPRKTWDGFGGFNSQFTILP